MELKNYIENAEKKAGSQKKLANVLGISAGYIRMAKGEKRGFPEAICIKLADYLNEDRLSVIAASGLVTEKDQERRKILESCFSASRAASFTATTLLLSVILIMTPSPAHASWATVSGDPMIEYFVLCKIIVEISSGKIMARFLSFWKSCLAVIAVLILTIEHCVNIGHCLNILKSDKQ